MERITECTENVTTDTDTDSLVSNKDFTLRKRKQGEGSTLRISDKNKTSTLTKKGLAKLQKDLVKKTPEGQRSFTSDNNALKPPPPPPPPPPSSNKKGKFFLKVS